MREIEVVDSQLVGPGWRKSKGKFHTWKGGTCLSCSKGWKFPVVHHCCLKKKDLASVL